MLAGSGSYQIWLGRLQVCMEFMLSRWKRKWNCECYTPVQQEEYRGVDGSIHTPLDPWRTSPSNSLRWVCILALCHLVPWLCHHLHLTVSPSTQTCSGHWSLRQTWLKKQKAICGWENDPIYTQLTKTRVAPIVKIGQTVRNQIVRINYP